MWHWQFITAAGSITLASIIGIALTLVSMPGMWIALLVAVGMQAWQPGLYSWWTLIACAVLALIGELMEFIASAAGAAKGGASKQGAIAAVAGSILGAIVGSFYLPPIGTILGGVLGAGIAVVWVELAFKERTLGQAAKAGTGAAAGRLVATVVKTGIAVCVAIILTAGAWWP